MTPRSPHPVRAGALALLTGLAVSVSPLVAQDSGRDRPVNPYVELSAPVTPFIFDGDVRSLPAPIAWSPGDPVKEIPRRFYPPPGSEQPIPVGPRIDPLLPQQAEATGMTSGPFTTPNRNFPGIGFTGVNPPDTVGDVGPDHYIQLVNSGGGASVRIFDKAEPVPNVIANFALDNLGGGACASGFGDPIVLYDRFAERWMLSEFSGSGNNLCVYISQTSDPVSGGWFNYQYTTPSFPDYPHYGVWPTDANGGQGSYVVTANDGGPGVFALNRGAMLGGTAGTFQRLTIPGLSGFGFETPTPADLDSANPPPDQAAAIIMRHRDTEAHSGSPNPTGDWLEMWDFDVDWVTPAGTTLIQTPNIEVAEFDSSLCGLTSFNCFPQPGTGTTLDPLREVIMNRLQYINHGDFESLVGNFVTDVNGSNLGGVRWFELRRDSGGWVLYQEGTYSIDSDNRWMGASAMDQSGNIALAYNVSSSTQFPSLRYTGRLSTDPLGSMTQPETVIHAGTSSNSSNRYGDYAAMNLDPADDCTFWFTGEDNTSSSWRTQIASFAFDACGCETAPSELSVTAAATGPNLIEVGWDDADLATVVEYSIGRSFNAGGPYETIATVTDTSPAVAGGPGYFFGDTDVSGGSTYHYIVIATDGAACTSNPSAEASATATGACTLAPAFAGLETAQTPFSAVCTVDLTWSAAAPNCGGPVIYNIYRSTAPGFTPGAISLVAAGVPTTTFSDGNVLDDDTSYFYVVRAVDQGNSVEEANLVEVEAIPQGPLTLGSWLDDAGDSGTAKLSLAAPWQINGGEGDSAPAVYKTGNYGDDTCAAITTPPLMLGTGSQLSFTSQYDIENSWDKGEVQISTDGVNWQRVPLAYPGNSTNTSDECGLPTGSYFTGPNNLGYLPYGADLSAFSGQVISLRFLMSSDGSVTESGWWIDDISVTEVEVPGACVTGSSCADNPFVDVTPQGPATICVGQDQLLTAELTGGSGPFHYQWTEDGIDIPGAIASTHTANENGSRVYNCKVRADSCPDEVFDGFATQVTWTEAPGFAGVAQVNSPPKEACTLRVIWNEATAFCGGPVTYDVYRSTDSPVAPTPENLIASGVSGDNHLDISGLADDTTYNYLVRATDESTGETDANIVEISQSPQGPLGHECQTLLSIPPSVPDGTLGTTPLHGSRITTSGDEIAVTWDSTSCPAVDYNLIYGDLANVATYAVDGAACAVGRSGSFSWTGVPSGDLYYLMVGTDGGTTESGWGTDSSAQERNGAAASGECSAILKDVSAGCP